MRGTFVATIPVFFVSMLCEWWVAKRRGVAPYSSKDSHTNLRMGGGSLVFGLGADAILITAVLGLQPYALFHIPSDAWWGLPLAILAVDFALYWSHRCHHEIRILWAAHVNHHSSERYNLSVALRQSWTGPYTGLPFYISLGLLGFSPGLLLSGYAVNLVYQFFVHTELVDRLWRPIEWVFNTPSHHRVHHGANVAYLDCNYGGILMIWDRIFGTFRPEEEPAVFGLSENIQTYNLWVVAFHEWHALMGDIRRAPTWKEKVQYALKPPGWSPDGTSLTSQEIQHRHGV